jgi:UDP-GlcNAc:undecaprenyl-phosphate GlcNAc-1-phosphate transferase
MRRLAGSRGWVAVPRKDRWHRRPVALHGGLGFFPPFIFGCVYILLRECRSLQPYQRSSSFLPDATEPALALLFGSTLLFLLGLLDDVRPLCPGMKILGQLIASSFFIFTGGVFHLTGFIAIDALVTYLWFIGIINAVNMLDNMDGLSSGAVIISAITLALLASFQVGKNGTTPLATPFCLLLSASLIGFWMHNRYPASIFMGDSGSLFIGYVLAALYIPGSLNGHLGVQEQGTIPGSVLGLVIPMTALAVPIFDCTLVTVTRIRNGKSPFKGGRDHASHRLVGLGMPESWAVRIFYLLAALSGLSAIMLSIAPVFSLPLPGLLALLLSAIGVKLGRARVGIPKQ